MNKNETFLRDIIEKLQKAIDEINKSIHLGEEDIASMQEYYWLNYTEMDEFGYENYDNKRALFLQENTNQEQRMLRSRYTKMMDNPYFGRVDFIYEGENEPESFYIGIGNFSPKKGMLPIIYDWRAPVSSLFYDYDAGDASYEAPGGTIKGVITAKGQYKIRRQKLLYAFESDVKIDDDVLAQELSGKGETHLKNIIQTIQKEQNVIIRNTKDEILIIQGVAGSGKTSVALHRIAYLLYHNRDTLKSNNVLILSPNGIFTDYISQILPELGEENIMEMSFDTFAYRELNQIVYDVEDRCDLMEHMLLTNDSSEYDLKQSREFISELDGYILMLDDYLFNPKDIHIGKWVKKAADIEKLFYYKFTEHPLLVRLDEIREYVIDEYETLSGRTLEQETSDLLKLEFDSMLATNDIYEIYSHFLADYGLDPLPNVSYEKRILSYEDVYPMLYLKYSLTGSRAHKAIKHLVIDEMQDYTYLQYRILSMLFNCKMTILGDKAQTLDSSPREVTSYIKEVFKGQKTYLEMNKSYRNTVEIADYAAKINSTPNLELFERHGEPVKTTEYIDEVDLISKLTRSLYDTKATDIDIQAIITYTDATARHVYNMLKDKVDNINFIDKNSKSFLTGITVIPYYLAKGLEFEHVYFIDDVKAHSMAHDQARYIAATRALHRLEIFSLK